MYEDETIIRAGGYVMCECTLTSCYNNVALDVISLGFCFMDLRHCAKLAKAFAKILAPRRFGQFNLADT